MAGRFAAFMSDTFERKATMSDPVRDLARFGVVLGNHQWSDGHPISGLRRAITSLRSHVNQFEGAARELAPWQHQSPLEWKERVGKLADVAVGSLEALAGDASRARARLEEVRGQLVFKINRSDLAAELRRQEIRGGLARLGDPLLVGAVLADALESDDAADADVVEAILSAPSVLGLLDRETADAGRARWARKVNAALADEETDLQGAVETFEANLTVALDVIRRAAELPERDPVAAVSEADAEVAG